MLARQVLNYLIQVLWIVRDIILSYLTPNQRFEPSGKAVLVTGAVCVPSSRHSLAAYNVKVNSDPLYSSLTYRCCKWSGPIHLRATPKARMPRLCCGSIYGTFASCMGEFR